MRERRSVDEADHTLEASIGGDDGEIRPANMEGRAGQFAGSPAEADLAVVRLNRAHHFGSRTAPGTAPALWRASRRCRHVDLGEAVRLIRRVQCDVAERVRRS